VVSLLRNLLSTKGLSSLLNAFGILWLLIQLTDFFLPNASNFLQNLWYVFLIIGLVVVSIRCRPTLSVCEKLKDRDITIEIAIGDLFSRQGDIIVGTNTTFDTKISRELISEHSVQGQFSKKYYGINSSQLDKEIDAELHGIPFTTLQGARVGKNKQYPLGTVVKLTPKECVGYFVAIADINEHGVAKGTFDDLKNCLAKLWVFIGNKGLKGDLIIPVLGSGFTRISTSRQSIIQEIIKSFIAACSEKIFCDKLIIIISENDASKNHIQIESLGNYLKQLCEYTEFCTHSTPASGTAVI